MRKSHSGRGLMSPRRVVLLMALVLFSGCALDVAGPDDGPIRVTLTVRPLAIDAPGAGVATLTYENVGTETVALSSAYGCLAFASVYRGEERIPFPSTQYACTAAVSYRHLDPDSVQRVEWPMVVGGENGIDVPAGTYRFVAELNTGHEDLERPFLIR